MLYDDERNGLLVMIKDELKKIAECLDACAIHQAEQVQSLDSIYEILEKMHLRNKEQDEDKARLL